MRNVLINAETFHCLGHFELRVASKDQIAGRGVVGKYLAQLLTNPLAYRMLGNRPVRLSIIHNSGVRRCLLIPVR